MIFQSSSLAVIEKQSEENRGGAVTYYSVWYQYSVMKEQGVVRTRAGLK